MSFLCCRGLLDSENVYLEFGCGRGMLSLALADILTPSSHIVLVDRASVRRKADKNLSRNSGCTYSRIRSDIADIALTKVPQLKERPVIAVSKHLCGGATDLALRSIEVSDRSASTPPPVAITGVAIATCCHHRCTWDQYVAQEWFKSLVR